MFIKFRNLNELRLLTITILINAIISDSIIYHRQKLHVFVYILVSES